MERCIVYAPEKGIEVQNPDGVRFQDNIFFTGDRNTTAAGRILENRFRSVDP